MELKIKYLNPDLNKLEKFINGDWCDLRSAQTVTLTAGEFALIPLGIAVKIPEGYEANIVPRSSTFKNYGILQTNSFGVVDNSYCGNEDEWKMPVYATRDCIINFNDRICQFRLNAIQPNFRIKEVDNLEGKNRGGFGSSGVQ